MTETPEQDGIPMALAEPLLPKDEEDGEQEQEEEEEEAASTTAPPAARRLRALAWAPSTHCLAKLLIPCLIVLTHVLFYHGQTADMWRLVGDWSTDLTFHVRSSESRSVCKLLHIPTDGSLLHSTNSTDIRTFTYAYAIKELWKAKGMEKVGVFLPRLASFGLVIFSGIWPHVKLIMLLLTWWFGRKPQSRRWTLTCLSILGKWSLVDVLVVVSMVGVLNVSFDFTAAGLMQGIKANLPSLLQLFHSMYNNEAVCTRALGYSCDKPRRYDRKAACNICKTAVADLVRKPEHTKAILDGVDVAGKGNGRLFVAGMDGIYSFCAAVILSILLSFVVDWYDLQYRKSLEEEEASDEERTSLAPEVTGTLSRTSTNDETDALLHQTERGEDRRTAADRAFDQQIFVERRQWMDMAWQVFAVLVAIVVAVATFVTTTERKVNGAIPGLLNQLLGVEWTTEYNFWSLGWITGKAGGRDYMLMGTFVWFVIAGPLLRALLNILASFCTEKPEMDDDRVTAVKRLRKSLSNWIDFVGAFCAWEVVTVASMMVDLLMPSITTTIINDARCGKLGQGTHQCFESEFNMTKLFGFVVAGWVLLLIISYHNRTYRFYES